MVVHDPDQFTGDDAVADRGRVDAVEGEQATIGAPPGPDWKNLVFGIGVSAASSGGRSYGFHHLGRAAGSST